MSHKFKVGDLVRVIDKRSTHYGKITHVTAIMTPAVILFADGVRMFSPVGFAVDIKPDNLPHIPVGFPPEGLEAVGKDDSNTKISWFDMQGLWAPKGALERARQRAIARIIGEPS